MFIFPSRSLQPAVCKCCKAFAPLVIIRVKTSCDVKGGWEVVGRQGGWCQKQGRVMVWTSSWNCCNKSSWVSAMATQEKEKNNLFSKWLFQFRGSKHLIWTVVEFSESCVTAAHAGTVNQHRDSSRTGPPQHNHSIADKINRPFSPWGGRVNQLVQ